MAAEPDTGAEQEDDRVLQEAESGIWAFSAPPDMTGDERELLPDIIALDHRSLRQLGHKTRHWTELYNLIYNTINRFQQREIVGARILFHKAAYDNNTEYPRDRGGDGGGGGGGGM